MSERSQTFRAGEVSPLNQGRDGSCVVSLTKSVPEWGRSDSLPTWICLCRVFFLYLAFNYIFFCTCQCCQQYLETARRGGDGWLVEDSSWTHLTVGWTLPCCSNLVAGAGEFQQRWWESVRWCVLACPVGDRFTAEHRWKCLWRMYYIFFRVSWHGGFILPLPCQFLMCGLEHRHATVLLALVQNVHIQNMDF